jgi:hypothetical protein
MLYFVEWIACPTRSFSKSSVVSLTSAHLQTLSHPYIAVLDPKGIVRTQSVSRRFLLLTRDNSLWKTKCFGESVAGRRLRRAESLVSLSQPSPQSQPGSQSAGANRYIDLAQRFFDTVVRRPTGVSNENAPNAETERHNRVARERMRALANWDPSFPDEKINFYDEYIQRHSPISKSWLETIKDGVGNEKEEREATGVGILYHHDGTHADKLYGALDDGSLCVWDVATGRLDTQSQGRALSRTRAGLLCGNSEEQQDLDVYKAAMTATGAVECVSIDSQTKRGYFTATNLLTEVDLETMQIISKERFAFPINAVSEARHPTPITIGTSHTIQLYDPRARHHDPGRNLENATRTELIGGRRRSNDFSRLLTGDLSPSHASLSQPGPLSILHLPDDRSWDGNGSIWVAGRFTSLLNYDRRFFPRLRGTVHSGARISCLRSRPHPYLPRELDLMRHSALNISEVVQAKGIPGTTLIAAGEYKGKGSLELYGLSSHPAYTTLSSDANTTRMRTTLFQNRQTASASKCLSVACHGGKLVYSDGDGNIRWMERDAFTPIRSWNINSSRPEPRPYRDMDLGSNGSGYPTLYDPPLFEDPEDIVQLLLPTMPKSTTDGHERIGEDNLVVWTGEGRIGLVGFSRKEKFDWSKLEDEALQHEEVSRRHQERQYANMMGHALRRQQDELNFMRNFGLGGGWASA